MAESDFEDEYDYFDEDDLFLIDDGPVNEVDDLAEHTMHSPVLINYDPGLIDDYSGWEYDTDDYYDGDASEPSGVLQSGKPQIADEKTGLRSNQGKRKRSDSDSRMRKRRKPDSTEAIPGLDLGESRISDATLRKLTRPLVVWRKEDQRQNCRLPLINAGDGVKVSLLKDWRERLGVAETPIRNGAKAKAVGQSSVRREKSTKTGLLSGDASKKNTKTTRATKRPREVDQDLGSSASDPGEDSLEHVPPAITGVSRKKTNENNLQTDNGGRQKDSLISKVATGGARKSKRLKNG